MILRGFVTSTCFFICCINLSFAASQPNTYEELEQKIEGIFEKLPDSTPGLSLIIKKDGRILIEKNKGLANKHENIAITSSTGFRIGSISKPFTAIAILQLQEKQKLSLNDSVRKYLPELPREWQQISLYQLLSHQVYLSKDFFSDSNLRIANGAENKNLLDFIVNEKVISKPLNSNQSVYCNTCFVLLAEVVEKASGSRFSEYMQENIFSPAQMVNTYIVTKGVPIKLGDALNYAKTDSFFDIYQYTTGAMAQVSSAQDLSRFTEKLKKFKLISSKSLLSMTHAHSKSNDGGSFGLGWIVGSSDQPFYAHGGSQDSYESELYINPEMDLEIIVLGNGGERTFDLKRELLSETINYFRAPD